jgi:hypothetical protein
MVAEVALKVLFQLIHKVLVALAEVLEEAELLEAV